MTRKLLLALPVVLAACAQDPVTDYLGGFGDPVRGAAFYAPRNLSDTSRYAGDPAGAAIAAAQLEFLYRSFREDPIRAPQTNPSTVFALQEGVREMRAALGIAPDAPGVLVEQQLREAAQALRAGSHARAEAALASPAFTAGPRATLARLAALPRLPRVAEAAGAASQEISRQDQGRLGIRL
jgi:hypothetical protein